jgi:hypothetical protein
MRKVFRYFLISFLAVILLLLSAYVLLIVEFREQDRIGREMYGSPSTKD